MRNAYSILASNPEGKRPLGRRRRKWEGNIRMDLREIGWERVDWIYLAQDPLAGSCEYGNETLGSIKDAR
jgi:hypothetical protein